MSQSNDPGEDGGHQDGNEFDFYFQFTKPLVLNLPTPEDRAIAAAWVQKLEAEPDNDEERQLRLDYLKLLLFVLQRGRLSGIFKKQPPTGPLQPFPQGFSMTDMGNLMIDQDEIQGCGGGDARSAPFTIEISNDLREFVAAQEIPNFGVQMYYAWSSDEPVHKWSLFDEDKFPQYILDKIKLLKEIKSEEKTSATKECNIKKLCDLPLIERYAKTKVKSPQEIEKSQGRSYQTYIGLVNHMGNGFKGVCNSDPDKYSQGNSRCPAKKPQGKKCGGGGQYSGEMTQDDEYDKFLCGLGGNSTGSRCPPQQAFTEFDSRVGTSCNDNQQNSMRASSAKPKCEMPGSAWVPMRTINRGIRPGQCPETSNMSDDCQINSYSQRRSPSPANRGCPSRGIDQCSPQPMEQCSPQRMGQCSPGRIENSPLRAMEHCSPQGMDQCSSQRMAPREMDHCSSQGMSQCSPGRMEPSPPRGMDQCPPQRMGQCPPQRMGQCPPRKMEHSPTRGMNHCSSQGMSQCSPGRTESSPPRGMDQCGPRGLEPSPPRGMDQCGPRGLEPSPPRGMDQCGPRGMESSPPRGMDQCGPRGMEPSPPRGIDQCGPRGMEPSPPRGMDQCGPRGMESSPPRGMDQCGPRGMEPSPPRGMDQCGPRGLESSPPRGMDQCGPRGMESSPARGMDQCGPRGMEPSPARGMDQCGPRGMDQRGPRGMDQCPSRGMDQCGPRGMESSPPRGMDQRGPRGMDQCSPRGMDQCGARGMDQCPPRGMDQCTPQKMGQCPSGRMEHSPPRAMDNYSPQGMDQCQPQRMGQCPPGRMEQDRSSRTMTQCLSPGLDSCTPQKMGQCSPSRMEQSPPRGMDQCSTQGMDQRMGRCSTSRIEHGSMRGMDQCPMPSVNACSSRVGQSSSRRMDQCSPYGMEHSGIKQCNPRGMEPPSSSRRMDQCSQKRSDFASNRISQFSPRAVEECSPSDDPCRDPNQSQTCSCSYSVCMCPCPRNESCPSSGAPSHGINSNEVSGMSSGSVIVDPSSCEVSGPPCPGTSPAIAICDSSQEFSSSGGIAGVGPGISGQATYATSSGAGRSLGSSPCSSPCQGGNSSGVSGLGYLPSGSSKTCERSHGKSKVGYNVSSDGVCYRGSGASKPPASDFMNCYDQSPQSENQSSCMNQHSTKHSSGAIVSSLDDSVFSAHDMDRKSRGNKPLGHPEGGADCGFRRQPQAQSGGSRMLQSTYSGGSAPCGVKKTKPDCRQPQGSNFDCYGTEQEEPEWCTAPPNSPRVGPSGVGFCNQNHRDDSVINSTFSDCDMGTNNIKYGKMKDSCGPRQRMTPNRQAFQQGSSEGTFCPKAEGGCLSDMVNVLQNIKQRTEPRREKCESPDAAFQKSAHKASYCSQPRAKSCSPSGMLGNSYQSDARCSPNVQGPSSRQGMYTSSPRSPQSQYETCFSTLRGISPSPGACNVPFPPSGNLCISSPHRSNLQKEEQDGCVEGEEESASESIEDPRQESSTSVECMGIAEEEQEAPCPTDRFANAPVQETRPKKIVKEYNEQKVEEYYRFCEGGKKGRLHSTLLPNPNLTSSFGSCDLSEIRCPDDIEPPEHAFYTLVDQPGEDNPVGHQQCIQYAMTWNIMVPEDYMNHPDNFIFPRFDSDD